MKEIESGRQNTYHLKCKIKVIDKGYKAKSGKVYQTPIVFLIPEDSTQRTRFFNAWLPAPNVRPSEIVGLIPHPLHSHCKLSVKRADEDVSEHHLVLLSIAAEKELLEFMKQDKIEKVEVEILPAADWEKEFLSKY